MREVDFRYLQSTLESLNSSTDLVLARGCVKVTLSRQCSPYASRRRVTYEQIAPIASDSVIVAANLRKILLVGLAAVAVEHATEAIGREGRPFSGSPIGWDGPRADWVCEPVPPTLPLLHDVLRCAGDYGMTHSDFFKSWLQEPLLYAAWLVPVVVEWDENGRPVFDWPDRPAESEPMDSDLPVEV